MDPRGLAAQVIERVSATDSLGRLQQLRGVDGGALAVIERGLVAHHHHAAFQGPEGGEAAARDCEGKSLISFSFGLDAGQESNLHLQALLGISMAGHRPSLRISGL